MSYHCLIVDDERTTREVLKEVFQREHYLVSAASSAREGLDLLESGPVDVVLSDERMPGMSGSEFLAIVRKRFPDTIRIILTGHASLDAAVRSINQGEVYRFFVKPCNLSDLLVSIRHALRLKDLEDQNRQLLKLLKEQSVLIRCLERRYPGITKVKKSAREEVFLDVDDPWSSETFSEEIQRLVSACKGRDRSITTVG